MVEVVGNIHSGGKRNKHTKRVAKKQHNYRQLLCEHEVLVMGVEIDFQGNDDSLLDDLLLKMHEIPPLEL